MIWRHPFRSYDQQVKIECVWMRACARGLSQSGAGRASLRLMKTNAANGLCQTPPAAGVVLLYRSRRIVKYAWDNILRPRRARPASCAWSRRSLTRQGQGTPNHPPKFAHQRPSDLRRLNWDRLRNSRHRIYIHAFSTEKVHSSIHKGSHC